MKKKEEKVSIEIPKLVIKKAKITLVGDTPLIVKSFSEKAKEEITAKQQKKAKANKDVNNVWEDIANSLHWITPKPEITNAKEFEKAIKTAKLGFPRSWNKTIGVQWSIQKQID